MIKNFKYFLYPTLIFGFTACTDLTETLKGDITENVVNAGIGSSGSGDVLSSAYGGLRSGSANHGGYYSIQELTSDELFIGAKGGDWYDGGALVELHRHTFTPVHGFFNSAWNGEYNAINTCNELLKGGTLDANQTAQTRALRAYMYSRLLDLYGNVKLITVPGEDVPQSTRVQVYNWVESEFLAALGISSVSSTMDLSSSPLNETLNSYRINRYAALGLLAKLYLNAEVYTGTAQWDKAAICASYVIDRGPYYLCKEENCAVKNLGKRPAVTTDPDELKGYAAVFAPNNEQNPEHVFAIYYDEVNGQGMNFAQMNLHYSSQFTWNFDSQPWNGYATVEDFYNSYEAGDARKAANFIVGPQKDFGGLQVLDYASDDGNPELNYTPAVNELEPNCKRESGARPGKFSFKQLGRNDMNNDFPVVRLGDLYLVRAEALARASGNWSNALPDVNIIRARAKVSNLGSLSADEFLKERGREMYQETSRRTDLIRFGKFNDAWWQKPASATHVRIFPIPQEQINASQKLNNKLNQNPGY